MLLPLAMESIHNSSNLFIPYEQLKATYSDPQKCEGIAFDFSYIESLPNPNFWYFHSLTNIDKQIEAF